MDYAFATAELHVDRLAEGDDTVLYAVGWLQGLMIGAALSAVPPTRTDGSTEPI